MQLLLLSASRRENEAFKDVYCEGSLANGNIGRSRSTPHSASMRHK